MIRCKSVWSASPATFEMATALIIPTAPSIKPRRADRRVLSLSQTAAGVGPAASGCTAGPGTGPVSTPTQPLVVRCPDPAGSKPLGNRSHLCAHPPSAQPVPHGRLTGPDEGSR